MKSNKYLLLFTCLISINFIGCKMDLNTKLLKFKENEEKTVSELTHELTGTVYVFKKNLSKENFLKYCFSVKIMDYYEWWEIALLIVDEKGNGKVYIVHPFYGTLNTLDLEIEVDLEKPYSIDELKIKNVAEHEYILFSQ